MRTGLCASITQSRPAGRQDSKFRIQRPAAGLIAQERRFASPERTGLPLPVERQWCHADKGRLALLGILPRWRCRHCGASVVTALDAVPTERDQNVTRQNLQEDQTCERQGQREIGIKAKESSLGFDPQRDQTGSRPRPTQAPQGHNNCRYHEGNRLAAALDPRFLRWCSSQEARIEIVLR